MTEKDSNIRKSNFVHDAIKEHIDLLTRRAEYHGLARGWMNRRRYVTIYLWKLDYRDIVHIVLNIT